MDAHFAGVAALVADPARARMLTALMDGRARTAKELAYGAGITPQTASSHLGKLLRARLLAMERQSRHRYFRLASPSVGHAVEALMAVSPPRARATAPETPLDEMRLARTCYDHLAGRLGVGVTEAMVRRRFLKPTGRDFVLTAPGARFLARLGVASESRGTRAFRPCLAGRPARSPALGRRWPRCLSWVPPGATLARPWVRGCTGSVRGAGVDPVGGRF